MKKLDWQDTYDDLGYDSALGTTFADDATRRRVIRDSVPDESGQLWLDQIPITLNPFQRSIYFQVNFGNLLHSNNDHAILPTELSDGIEVASEKLGVHLGSSRLIGLHVAGSSKTDAEPTTYYPHIRSSPRYQLFQEGDTLYINNRKANVKSDITRVFYPKNMTDETTGEIFYRLRMEDRIHRHLRTHLKLGKEFPILQLDDLKDPCFFEASINWWKRDLERFMLPEIKK